MIEEKINALGLSIPNLPPPAGAYIPAKKVGNFVFTSGQIPRINGEWIAYGRGKVGSIITKEQAYNVSQACCLNALAAIKQAIGSLDNIDQIIKVVVFVASEVGFTEQPFVGNGCSDLLKEIFGTNGEHARSAVGVIELPLGASVELELIVSIKNDCC